MFSKFLTLPVVILIILTATFAIPQSPSISLAQSTEVPTPGNWAGTLTFSVPQDAAILAGTGYDVEITFEVTEDSRGMIGTTYFHRDDDLETIVSWAAPIQDGLFSVQITLPDYQPSYVNNYHMSWAGVFVSSTEVEGILSVDLSYTVLAKGVEWTASPVTSE